MVIHTRYHGSKYRHGNIRHGNMVTHAYISLYHSWYFGFSTTWSSKMQSINNIIENETPLKIKKNNIKPF